MGVIFHKNKKYGGTGVKVQSDPAATSLNALDVPNGQTMTSYLNSNFVYFGTRKTIITPSIATKDYAYVADNDFAVQGKTYIGTVIDSLGGSSSVQVTTHNAGANIGIRFNVLNLSSVAQTVTIGYRHLYIATVS